MMKSFIEPKGTSLSQTMILQLNPSFTLIPLKRMWRLGLTNLYMVDKSSLVQKYGHLSHLLRMSFKQMKRYKNITDDEIFEIMKLQNDVRESYRRSFKEEGINIYSERFQNYCFIRLQKLKNEVLLAFFLDEQEMLISDEIVHIGVRLKVALDAGDILCRARYYGAKSLIVMHNHPGGGEFPSRADVRVSQNLFSICEGVGIKCHASLIVAGEKMLNICPKDVENLTKLF